MFIEYEEEEKSAANLLKEVMLEQKKVFLRKNMEDEKKKKNLKRPYPFNDDLDEFMVVAPKIEMEVDHGQVEVILEDGLVVHFPHKPYES